MFRRILQVSLLVSLAVVSPTVGQTPTTPESIRAAIKDLESKLQDLEAQHAAAQGSRTTRIGHSKVPVQDAEVNELVVQLYDLGDLFAVTPAYAAMQQSDLSANSRPFFPVVETNAAIGSGTSSGFVGGGLGGGGGGFFAVPPGKLGQDALFQFGGAASASSVPSPAGNLAGTRASLEDLMDAIQTTIEPENWSDAGGSGSMARIGNSLLISATNNMHRQIGDLLLLFRKRWGTLRTVSIRAYWLWLTERELTGLLVPPDRQQDLNLNTEPFGRVDPEIWNKLLTAPIRAEATQPGNYFATVTGYNGQTVHTLAGNQRIFVTGVTPVDGGQAKEIGYSPSTAIVHEGAALQLTPLTSTNAKYVVLDVHSRVSRVVPKAAPHAADESATKTGQAQITAAALDRPVVETHRLSTTLRVPTGQILLVGGLSSDMARVGSSGQLYLFVQAFVQELRDEPVDKALPEAAPNTDGSDREGSQAKGTQP